MKTNTENREILSLDRKPSKTQASQSRSVLDSSISESLSLEKESDTGVPHSYQYIFKLILIGDANIGKTSLINRYVTNTFSESYICTIGVDFMMKSVLYENQTLKLQIWDTAGMERYKQLTTSYYRGAQGAIVCFDVTNRASFESVSKWIDNFCQFNNPIFERIIILVGNKSDLVEEREVSKEEIDKYVKVNNYEYYETSAKTGNNVDELFFNLAVKLYKCYRDNMNQQINNSIKIRRTTLSNVDKFQNLMDKQKKKKGCC